MGKNDARIIAIKTDNKLTVEAKGTSWELLVVIHEIVKSFRGKTNMQLSEVLLALMAFDDMDNKSKTEEELFMEELNKLFKGGK